MQTQWTAGVRGDTNPPALKPVARLGLVALAVGTFLAGLCPWLAGAQYVSGPVVNGAGGGPATATAYILTATAGQPAVGVALSAAYALNHGFWNALNFSPQTEAAGATTWAGGGSLEWQINDATGTRGGDPGWDWLNITGDLIVTATNQPVGAAQQFTLRLVTLSGNEPGLANHFNNAVTNSWVIATASGAVNGFNANKFILDASGFQNPVEGGAFSLVLVDRSVQLVFTPAGNPCQNTTVATSGVTNGDMHMCFVNPGGLTSVQALTLTNCTMTGTAYDLDGVVLSNGIGPVSLTARATLPNDTVKLLLVAVKTPPATQAAVNEIVLDTCGRGVSFDPVFTTLAVTSGHLAQQRFTGLLAAEHYLHVVNGAPGLHWLEVVLNGHKFRLDPLADGAEVSADLRAALIEGADNAVLLTGYGDIAASALVLITDAPVGNLVQLPEVAELTLMHAGGQMVASWPATLPGWQLQASATLETGWEVLAATPTAVEGRWSVPVKVGGGAQFFRLHAVEPAPRQASASSAVGTAARTVSLTGSPAAQPTQPTIRRTHDGLFW
jgi:hypothetical protein